MKPQPQPQSKIPTTGKNTNQKKKGAPGDPLNGEPSLLKKNEFTLIIAGALVVTVLVFFLFFRDSGKPPAVSSDRKGQPSGEIVDRAMEKRVAELEVTLARLASSPAAGDLNAGDATSRNLGDLEARLERLETAMTLKMDTLIGRLAKVESGMANLKKAAAKPAPVVKVAETPPAPVEKKAAVPQKTAQKTTKKSMFHTVQKGETLWSISQKYKTTVTAIRELNKLSPEDNIYPGTNILVR